jgi:ABC-type uncharacterized transport system substrate-binding protein
MEEVPMTRRTIGLPVIFALAILVAPLAARPQPPARLPTIGFFGATTPSAQSPWTVAFVQRLRELGWIEGRNFVIEYRWAEGRTERFAEIAAEFVRLKVDVIVTHGTAQVVAAQQATSVIPIVSAVTGDPVGTGLVASLARPGGNITGLSVQSTDLAVKRLELLREVVPDLRRLAIMANVGHPPSLLEVREVQTTARTLGLDVATVDIRQAEDIAPAFDALKGRGEALYIPPIRSSTPTACASPPWRWARACRRYPVFGSTSSREVSCPMDQTTRTCFGAPRPTWTRSSRAPSLPTSPSSNRRSSSWSSTSRLLKP